MRPLRFIAPPSQLMPQWWFMDMNRDTAFVPGIIMGVAGDNRPIRLI